VSADTAVFDASPLIVFQQVGQLDLLRALFDRAVVPTAVAEEVAPSLGVLPSWIEVHPVFTNPAISALLHAGERAAISLAVQLGADFVILDDLAGRKAAERIGLAATGSLGLLVRAKRGGMIREVNPLMDAMIAAGLFVSDGLYHRILSIAGESD
jgi:predicted nucleic acid-binding protein